jgi:chemotaxis signal transduction protein
MNPSQDMGEANGLNLLLFSAGGVRFGVDAAQIAGTAAVTGDDAEKPAWLHELLEFGDRQVVYREPVILEVGTDGAGRWRVVVDAMEDIITVAVHEILPLPPPVELHVLGKGLWGVLPRGGMMILLMDFRLLQNRKTILIPAETPGR